MRIKTTGRSNARGLLFLASIVQAAGQTRTWTVLFKRGARMLRTQLFEGPNLRLSAVDPEQDAKIETAWTYDLDYTQQMMSAPARPLGAMELKKQHEDDQKHADEGNNQFYFAIRLKEADQLVGFVRFPIVFWTHSAAWLRLAIADPGILARFGREALEMALVYGFRVLNLYRVETTLAAYQNEMISLFEAAGFLLEVRRRQVFYRNGQYYDALHFGLLQEEWKNQADGEAAA
jgi:RimJ/RimL family protein N-acetyltransferase